MSVFIINKAEWVARAERLIRKDGRHVSLPTHTIRDLMQQAPDAAINWAAVAEHIVAEALDNLEAERGGKP